MLRQEEIRLGQAINLIWNKNNDINIKDDRQVDKFMREISLLYDILSEISKNKDKQLKDMIQKSLDDTKVTSGFNFGGKE